MRHASPRSPKGAKQIQLNGITFKLSYWQAERTAQECGLIYLNNLEFRAVKNKQKEIIAAVSSRVRASR